MSNIFELSSIQGLLIFAILMIVLCAGFTLHTFCSQDQKNRIMSAFGVLCSGFVAYALIFLSDPWVREALNAEISRLVS